MKKILLIAATAMLFVGCGKDKFKEINSDPTAVSKPDPSFLFLAAQNSLRGGEYITWFYVGNRHVLPWAQITVGDRGGLNNAAMFDMSRTDNPFWGNLYGGVGGSVKEMQNVIKNMDERASLSFQNMYHMGQILMVQAGIYATDFNGSVPYSEALQGLYTNPPLIRPVYDNQESLFTQFDAELKAAINTLSNPVVDQEGKEVTQIILKSSQEPVYKGNITKWIQYANALRLKIALRLLHANPTLAKAIAQEVATDGRYMKTNDDDYRYVSGKWDFGPGSGTWTGTAAKSFVEMLKEHKDPRVRFFFNKNPYNAGVIQGMLDEGIVFPDYIADEMVVTDGKFIRWKSREMGDGDQYMGEPWVRFQGIPAVTSGELTQAEKDKYVTEDKFKINVGDTKRTFMPHSAVSQSLLSPNDTRIYPSVNVTQDEYRPNNAYNYSIVLESASTTSLTLAVFALQGVNVPGTTANDLYRNGIECSVKAYDKTAEMMNVLYYSNVYDMTTFKNAENKDEVIEKPLKLQDKELVEMMALPIHSLSGNVREDIEKCFVQLVINAFHYPADIYTYTKFGGIPMYNSNVWKRVPFYNDLAVDQALNIPRRFNFSEPNKGGVNYENQKKAYEDQGFFDYGAASPPMSEKYWNDKNSPAWGAGPIVR